MSVNPDQLYEQTLVLQSQLGDEAAFAELLERHGPRILLFTQRMMQSSPSDIADLTQEIWLAIFRGLPGLLDARSFRSWAFRIARDRIYREYRRRKAALLPLDETVLETLEIDEDDGKTVDVEALRQCLLELGPAHREALILRFLEDMNYEQIARATGATVGTVRSRLHYGKRALRAAWERRQL
ncbi:MAG: RNA polymerase sigma factor [Verrucomicrobia bacterium]|nr:RNA polymerase sigma factor [Verrucomicrobiota bacterium]MBI3868456.1 RNA polymerase sigma factor [Verrucomicrobiota bacterium]